MRVVTKEVALAELGEHRKALLGGELKCVMCALAGRKDACERIAESAHAVVLLDRFASRYGHLMVIAKRHAERATELDWPVYSDIQRLAFDAIRVVEQCFEPARVFTATLGAAVELPMTYSHYHVHVIPVAETDERARPARVLSWSEGVLLYEDREAESICQKLRRAWPHASH